MHLKRSDKYRPVCLGLNVLMLSQAVLSEQNFPYDLILLTLFILFGVLVFVFVLHINRGIWTTVSITRGTTFTTRQKHTSVHLWNEKKTGDWPDKIFQEMQLELWAKCGCSKLKPEYSGQTGLIPWLLMPWLLASPGHQQPWCWLYKISGSLSYPRKDFNYSRDPL